jgi:hypothetical protein
LWKNVFAIKVLTHNTQQQHQQLTQKSPLSFLHFTEGASQPRAVASFPQFISFETKTLSRLPLLLLVIYLIVFLLAPPFATSRESESKWHEKVAQSR